MVRENDKWRPTIVTLEQAKEILVNFNIDAKTIGPTGNGHINDTYLVCTDDAKYIMQKVNTAIFTDPVGLMNNIIAVTSHVKQVFAAKGETSKKTLEFLTTNTGDTLYYYGDNAYRVCKFIDAHSIDCAEHPSQLYEAGRAFGNFQSMLADFDASTLIEVIPKFHDTANRYENFEKAVAAASAERLAETEEEIAFVRSKKEKASLVVNGIVSGEIPLRVTHNDTKINNILFNDEGSCVAVIDLDTVMPGSMLYDFGDAMRSGGTTADEDEVDLSLVHFNLENFEQYVRGYLEEFPTLSDREVELIPFSAFLLTYECGMRFLTDYLMNDVYFKIAYPTHNLVRAKNQFALARDMESKFDAMAKIIGFPFLNMTFMTFQERACIL